MLYRLIRLSTLMLGCLTFGQPASAVRYTGDVDAAVAATVAMQRFEKAWERTEWEKQISLGAGFIMRWVRSHPRGQHGRECIVVMYSDTEYSIALYEGKFWPDKMKTLQFAFKWQVQFLRFSGPAQIPLYRITLDSPEQVQQWERFGEICGMPKQLQEFE